MLQYKSSLPCKELGAETHASISALRGANWQSVVSNSDAEQSKERDREYAWGFVKRVVSSEYPKYIGGPQGDLGNLHICRLIKENQRPAAQHPHMNAKIMRCAPLQTFAPGLEHVVFTPFSSAAL